MYEQKNLFNPSQFGFGKAYYTRHAITDIVNAIQTNTDNRLFSCGIFIYLEKAFDSLDHKILLRKLHHYSFRGHINIRSLRATPCKVQFILVQFWPPLSVVTLRSRRERVQGHLSGHARAKPIRADQSAGC